MPHESFYLLHILLAVGLSFLIGAEREFYQKSAGIRTHTLVGLGSALFMVISKYGFFDLFEKYGGSLDGSRVAAQVVSGIGFIGAGLIFVKRDNVRGLTTAASIWLVAAVGMAAGAGMFIVAPGATLLYLLITVGIRPISRWMPNAPSTVRSLQITYEDGRGILRSIMEMIGSHGLQVGDLNVLRTRQYETETDPQSEAPLKRPQQRVEVQVHGSAGAFLGLTHELSALEGVESLASRDLKDDETDSG